MSREQVDDLGRLWERYLSEFSAGGWVVDGSDEEKRDRQLHLLGLVETLQKGVDEVGLTAQAEMTEQVVLASRANARAHQLSWLTAGLAVVISVLILWLTVRAINSPLRKLTEGTQAVSQGEFSYRLDSSGHDEFSKLAGSFNDMVEQLGDAERVKKEFLSHVSHELKSPLASMEETTELLLDEIPGPLTSKQKAIPRTESGERSASIRDDFSFAGSI